MLGLCFVSAYSFSIPHQNTQMTQTSTMNGTETTPAAEANGSVHPESTRCVNLGPCACVHMCLGSYECIY